MSTSTNIDAHVGDRIRARREALGMTAEQLSAALGVAVQQMEAHEAGSRRVGAASLLKLSKILQSPPAFFFEGLSTERASGGEECHEHPQSLNGALRLLRLFMGIKDAAARKKIIDFAMVIAREQAPAKNRQRAPAC